MRDKCYRLFFVPAVRSFFGYRAAADRPDETDRGPLGASSEQPGSKISEITAAPSCLDGAGLSSAQIRDPSGRVCMRAWAIGAEKRNSKAQRSTEEYSVVRALRPARDFFLRRLGTGVLDSVLAGGARDCKQLRPRFSSGICNPHSAAASGLLDLFLGLARILQCTLQMSGSDDAGATLGAAESAGPPEMGDSDVILTVQCGNFCGGGGGKKVTKHIAPLGSTACGSC